MLFEPHLKTAFCSDYSENFSMLLIKIELHHFLSSLSSLQPLPVTQTLKFTALVFFDYYYDNYKELRQELRQCGD